MKFKRTKIKETKEYLEFKKRLHREHQKRYEDRKKGLIVPYEQTGIHKKVFVVTDEERFLEKIDKASNSKGCWLWAASCLKKSGYGLFKFKGKIHRAHRVAYKLWVNPNQKYPIGYNGAYAIVNNLTWKYI